MSRLTKPVVEQPDERTSVGVSVKFPTESKHGGLSIDEFNQLFELSGDKNKSTFIHNAVRHYAEVIRVRLAEDKQKIIDRSSALEALFPKED